MKQLSDFILPNVTQQERDLLNAVKGIIVFNTTSGKIENYDGVKWNNVNGSDGATVGGTTYNESSIYRTPTLTGQTNNLDIPNIENYSLIVITISENIDLTGILRTGITEYQSMRIVIGNTDNKKLKLIKKSGDSLEVARFYMEKDIELKEGQWWDLLSHKDLDVWTGQGKIK